MTHPSPSRRLAVIAVTMLLTGSACGSTSQSTTPVELETSPDSSGADPAEKAPARTDSAALGATEVSEPAQRLVVADGTEPLVRVVDPRTGDEVAVLELPGVARVSANGRNVWAPVRDADRFEVIDAGTWAVPAGDHSHYYVSEPTVTEIGFDADDPTHVVDHHGLVAIFNDGDGSVVIIDAEPDGDDPVDSVTISSGAAHHGVAVALREAGVAIVSTPVQDESLPDGVAVHELASGQEVARFGDCPRLHGEASTHDVVAFGCADGVLVIEHVEGQWSARKIARPADAGEDDRTGTLGTVSEDLMFGNLGRETLARIDLAEDTATSVPLPETMSSFAVDPASQTVVVLTIDGLVHRIDANSAAILDSVPVLDAFVLPEGHGGPPVPRITVAGGRAYVTDPDGGRVFALGVADELTVEHEYFIGGTPASVALAEPRRRS